MANANLTQVSREKGYCVGAVGNVLVVVWNDRPTVETVQVVGSSIESLLAAQPHKVAMMVVVGKDSPPPDAAARDTFAAIMRKHADRLCGAALVIEGTGLRSAAARAVATAIQLISSGEGLPQPQKTVEDAARTLTDLLRQAGAPTLPPPLITLAVSELRHPTTG